MQVRLTFGGGADTSSRDDAATVTVTAATAAATAASASASASATSVEEEAGFVTKVFKAAIRDPTTTAVLRVDTIDSTTLLPCVVGTAVLKMFVASKEDRAQVQ